MILLHFLSGDISMERIAHIGSTSQQIEFSEQLVNEVISENRIRNLAMVRDLLSKATDPTSIKLGCLSWYSFSVAT